MHQSTNNSQDFFLYQYVPRCILLSEVVYCIGTCLHIEKLLIEENSLSLPYNSNKHFNNRLQVKTPGKKCKRRDSIKVLL